MASAQEAKDIQQPNSIRSPISIGQLAYRLGPGDKINLKVLEWRPSVDQIYAWEALNTKYTIGPSGQLALPLVGEIPAAGLSTEELARQIAEHLRDRMRLAAPPDATVEIIEYRPFYIVGVVEKPGQYPYEPGLTVLRAVSLAGGLTRAREAAAMRLQREAISARGELNVLLHEMEALIAKNARLEAELSGASQIDFPQSLTDQRAQAGIARLLEQERMIFDARKQGFETQLSALKQLRNFLEEEIKSMQSQIEVHKQQQRLIGEELKKVRGLADRGLTTSTRQLDLERIATQLEGEGLRLEGNLIKTRQDVSRTDISILELQNKRQSDITVDLRETKQQLDTIQTKRSTAAKLVYEAEVTAPGLILDDDIGPGSQIVYKIIREVGGKAFEIGANETMQILPGDTIKAEVTKPAVLRQSTEVIQPGPSSSTGLAAAAQAPKGKSAKPE
ncbi:MAG: sugar ABC transporter substrate-binding protein [Rhodomicrobium sp.]|nr:sugar ABC transporter substrate-binding protein [Rhodomicrobium sp.]